MTTEPAFQTTTWMACTRCHGDAFPTTTVEELQGPGQAGLVEYTHVQHCPHCDAQAR